MHEVAGSIPASSRYFLSPSTLNLQFLLHQLTDLFQPFQFLPLYIIQHIIKLSFFRFFTNEPIYFWMLLYTRGILEDILIFCPKCFFLWSERSNKFAPRCRFSSFTKKNEYISTHNGILVNYILLLHLKTEMCSLKPTRVLTGSHNSNWTIIKRLVNDTFEKNILRDTRLSFERLSKHIRTGPKQMQNMFIQTHAFTTQILVVLNRWSRNSSYGFL